MKNVRRPEAAQARPAELALLLQIALAGSGAACLWGETQWVEHAAALILAQTQ
jgi:hypothetical protein